MAFGASKRVAAVDGYQFPVGVRQRLAAARPHLTQEQLTMVESAARQWFRLHARRPRGERSMPSVLVADWCREFARHEREYAAFTATAIGRPLPSSPPFSSARLAVTYRQARAESPQELPLLFRVDKEAGVPDGKRYLEDCGGRGQCWPLPGVVCLQHLDGLGRDPRKGQFLDPPPPPEMFQMGGDPGGL